MPDNIQNNTMSSYNFKVVPEANWYALGAAIGAIVGAVMAAFGVDGYIIGLIVPAVAGLPRAIAGVLLPSPPITGGQADKST